MSTTRTISDALRRFNQFETVDLYRESFFKDYHQSRPVPEDRLAEMNTMISFLNINLLTSRSINVADFYSYFSPENKDAKAYSDAQRMLWLQQLANNLINKLFDDKNSLKTANSNLLNPLIAALMFAADYGSAKACEQLITIARRRDCQFSLTHRDMARLYHFQSVLYQFVPPVPVQNGYLTPEQEKLFNEAHAAPLMHKNKPFWAELTKQDTDNNPHAKATVSSERSDITDEQRVVLYRDSIALYQYHETRIPKNPDQNDTRKIIENMEEGPRDLIDQVLKIQKEGLEKKIKDINQVINQLTSEKQNIDLDLDLDLDLQDKCKIYKEKYNQIILELNQINTEMTLLTNRERFIYYIKSLAPAVYNYYSEILKQKENEVLSCDQNIAKADRELRELQQTKFLSETGKKPVLIGRGTVYAELNEVQKEKVKNHQGEANKKFITDLASAEANKTSKINALDQAKQQLQDFKQKFIVENPRAYRLFVLFETIKNDICYYGATSLKFRQWIVESLHEDRNQFLNTKNLAVGKVVIPEIMKSYSGYLALLRVFCLAYEAARKEHAMPGEESKVKRGELAKQKFWDFCQTSLYGSESTNNYGLVILPNESTDLDFVDEVEENQFENLRVQDSNEKEFNVSSPIDHNNQKKKIFARSSEILQAKDFGDPLHDLLQKNLIISLYLMIERVFPWFDKDQKVNINDFKKCQAELNIFLRACEQLVIRIKLVCYIIELRQPSTIDINYYQTSEGKIKDYLLILRGLLKDNDALKQLVRFGADPNNDNSNAIIRQNGKFDSVFTTSAGEIMNAEYSEVEKFKGFHQAFVRCLPTFMKGVESSCIFDELVRQKYMQYYSNALLTGLGPNALEAATRKSSVGMKTTDIQTVSPKNAAGTKVDINSKDGVLPSTVIGVSPGGNNKVNDLLSGSNTVLGSSSQHTPPPPPPPPSKVNNIGESNNSKINGQSNDVIPPPPPPLPLLPTASAFFQMPIPNEAKYNYFKDCESEYMKLVIESLHETDRNYLATMFNFHDELIDTLIAINKDDPATYENILLTQDEVEKIYSLLTHYDSDSSNCSSEAVRQFNRMTFDHENPVDYSSDEEEARSSFGSGNGNN